VLVPKGLTYCYQQPNYSVHGPAAASEIVLMGSVQQLVWAELSDATFPTHHYLLTVHTHLSLFVMRILLFGWNLLVRSTSVHLSILYVLLFISLVSVCLMCDDDETEIVSISLSS